MGGEDRFERELRSTLHDLASAPAPEHLVERVAAVPEEASMNSNLGRRRGGFSLMRAAYGLVGAAVVVLIAVAVIVSRPGGNGAQAGAGPSASPTPAASAVTVATAPASGTPASTAPSTPSPSASASTVAGPAGGPVPSGMQAISVTFASPELGWVLGTAPCTAQPCTSIVRTSDAGKTWAGIPAPKAPLGQANTGQPGPGVSSLRFANATDGWAYGPGLWATHDGGTTWTQLAVPGGSAASVVALETSNGVVHAVVYGGASEYRIASSPIGKDDWTLSPVRIQVGAGPVPRIQLVLNGAGGWVLENDRVVTGGARLVNGSWESWTPPCSKSVGPAVIGASSATDLFAACDVGQWANPQGEHVYASTDGGVTWSQTSKDPLQSAADLTTSGPSVVLVAGGGSNGGEIVGSFDGGKAWTSVFRASNATLTDLGYTTIDQGVVIASTGGEKGSLYMTRDGGHTWTQVTF